MASRQPRSNDCDRSRYTAGSQSLVSATNDPRSDSSRSGWFGFKAAVDTSWRDPPPPLDSWKYPNITRADFERYLQIVGHGRVEQFQQDRDSLAEGLKQQQLLEGEGVCTAAVLPLLLLGHPCRRCHMEEGAEGHAEHRHASARRCLACPGRRSGAGAAASARPVLPGGLLPAQVRRGGTAVVMRGGGCWSMSKPPSAPVLMHAALACFKP